MKLKYKRIKQRHTLICYDLKKEGINRKELDILYEPPEGLIRVIDFNDIKKIITYDVGCCIPLESYYKQKCFTETEVLQIVKQFLTVLEKMEQYHLTKQKLILEFKHVFFNMTQAIPEFVFCPVQNNYFPLESEQIFSFLKELVTKAVIIRDKSNSNDDKIQSFLLFLRKQQQFSVEAISIFFDKNYIAKSLETEIHIDTPILSVSYSQASQKTSIQSVQCSPCIPGFTSNSPESVNRQKFENVQYATPVIQSPVSISQTEYNRKKSSSELMTSYNEPVVPSSIVSPSDTIDDTEVPVIQKPGDTITINETAYIRSELTKIEYELPFGDCIIGRTGTDENGNPVTPDLVVTDNLRVRKFHIKIIYDGNSYYVIDLATKGKTRVNDVIIESGIDANGYFNGKKTKIENGTKIQLASELFTFLIKES